MEWFIFLGSVVAGYLYFKSSRQKPDISMLPEQFIVFDLETTGLDPIKHEIIEIGAVKVNRDFNNHTTFQALIKPSKKVPKRITEITGITQEMVEAEGEEIGSALKEFADFIGDLRLVTFNAKFDMGFLKKATKPRGILLRNPVSCALKMARRAWPGLKSYKLADLANIYGLNSKGNHRALKDCELTVIIYAAAASKLGSVN
jgi:DNA polymerase III epsilon subunit family exonuclease